MLLFLLFLMERTATLSRVGLGKPHLLIFLHKFGARAHEGMQQAQQLDYEVCIHPL